MFSNLGTAPNCVRASGRGGMGSPPLPPPLVTTRNSPTGFFLVYTIAGLRPLVFGASTKQGAKVKGLLAQCCREDAATSEHLVTIFELGDSI